MSATEGVCGSADGRGILFDREVPPTEKILVSYLVGEFMFVIDWAKFDKAPMTRRMKNPCTWAAGESRLEYSSHRAGWGGVSNGVQIVDILAWESALAKGSALTDCLRTWSRGRRLLCTCVLQLHPLRQAMRMPGRHKRTARVVPRSSGTAHQGTSEQGHAVTWFRGWYDSVLL
jgi:hypothetical protein